MPARPRRQCQVLVMAQLSRGNRRGDNFTVRWSPAERAEIERMRSNGRGPRSLGPWLVWAAAGQYRAGVAVPGQAGHCPLDAAVPAQRAPASSWGTAAAGALPELCDRVVLDLCGGSGSWSRPYAEAGYRVELVTLPDGDVRTYEPPPGVWGVLAAPPCTEFSVAKTVGERDFARALEEVCACMRIIALARPRWWALENPGSGLLRRWLGPPRDTWQPCDFGDPWTKLTAIWGDFALPARVHVVPTSGMVGANAAERAVTPPGFARAFFTANP